MTKIKCKLIKEIFKNEINGYNISIVKILDSDDLELLEQKKIYAVGVFESLNNRLNYLMEGNLEKHPKYGVQFKINTYKVDIPTKEEELVEFLSSDMFPIGEKTASKIVDKFGENTIEVILNDYEQLLQIPRLSKNKIEQIHIVLEEHQASSEAILELSKLGFNVKEAGDILAKYKSNTLNVINTNIYRLVEEMEFSFNDIDAIARNNGIDLEDANRIKALIEYLIEDMTFSTGDTYVLLDDLFNQIQKYCDIPKTSLEYYLSQLIMENRVKKYNDNYYLQKYYQAEKYIANRLCQLSDIKKRKFPNLEEKIKKLEKKNKIKYDEIQKKAMISAINNNLTIITGGPGTGKTTIIKSIVSLLKEVYKATDFDIALLAPTGRAARRMMETTKLDAYTIHKYLVWDKEKNTFNKNEYDPNLEKYIIIDEASMIDTLVMEALLKGIKKQVKLILVGDYYQLPSVSQGQVLKDLIDSDMLDVVKLNNLYRQNEHSYIPILAQEIKNKKLTNKVLEKSSDYNFIECPKEQVLFVVNSIIKKALDKGYDESNIQVLAPMYKTVNGIDNLNKNLQEIFNPNIDMSFEINLTEVTYRKNDKVLQLVNETESGIANGDIGYIHDIVPARISESKKNEIIVDFDGNLVTYTPDKYINLKHAYAISVHKSQGNEFEMVILPIVNSFNRMLYNKLIYTAVTRAKKSLIIVGDKDAFIKAVNNDYIDTRKTTLKEFIIDRYCNMSIK